MNENVKNNVKLGLFIIVGLVLFVAAIYYIGARQNVFSSVTTVYAVFKNVDGLKEGSNVRFAGINVGTVKEVQIISDSTVKVTLTIAKSAADFIKENSSVTISTEGLIGSKMVSVLPGSPDSPSISDGDRLPAVQPTTIDEIMELVKQTGRNARDITGDVKSMVALAREGEGLLGGLVADTTLDDKLKETVAHFNRSSHNLLDFSEDAVAVSQTVAEGEGTIGRLVFNERVVNKLNNILDSLKIASRQTAEMTRSLAQFAEKINEGDGPLNKIVTDSAMNDDLTRLIENVNDAAQEINTTAEKLNNSWLLNGLLGGGTDDEESGESAE